MHWRNSSFQVAYFLVGKCHTPDEAYRVLKELREERQLALNNVKVEDLRTRAKMAAAFKAINTASDDSSILMAHADLAEVEAFKSNGQACIDEAQREVEFIDKMLVRLQPHRKYANLPDHEAYQLCQQEEWKYELIFRAENYLMGSGTIPPEQLATMRMHPEWPTEIGPYVKEAVKAIRNQGEIVGMFTRPMDTLLVEVAGNIGMLLT